MNTKRVKKMRSLLFQVRSFAVSSNIGQEVEPPRLARASPAEKQNNIMIKTMKRNLFVLPVVLLAIVAGCKRNAGVAGERASEVAVKVTEASTGENGGGLPYSGTIEEDNAVMVSFAAQGTIKSLAVSEGQRVSKGQYLGSVDATQAENALAAAKASVLQAQDAYDRMKQLYESKSIPEMKWVEVQSKLLQAKSTEQTALKAVADCRLYSPTSGVVSEKLAEVGQNVMPGTPVAKVVGTSVLKVKIAVPEGEMSLLKPGQKAQVCVDALDGRQFDAVMTEKGVDANEVSRSYDVKFRICGAHDGLLPGMVASVKLRGATASANCSAAAQITVPANVVQQDYDNRTFVWTVRSGKAQKTYVTCGEFVGDGVVVSGGLSAGDKVIVEGQHKVCNGTRVKII